MVKTTISYNGIGVVEVTEGDLTGNDSEAGNPVLDAVGRKAVIFNRFYLLRLSMFFGTTTATL